MLNTVKANFTHSRHPAPPDDQLTFLLGSCRYPGLLWKIKEADRIFGPMLDHFLSPTKNPFGQPARFVMMSGDQIYADSLNKNIPLMRADTFKEFQDRYVGAFGAPNLRRLMRNSTSYMILDDHEIEDNWSQDRIKEPKGHQLFNIAIGAYLSYQWSHGPRTWGRLLYYTFDCGAHPFFVIDTRTQRYKDDAVGLADNHLLGRPSIDPAFPGQLNCLLTWLINQQTKHGDAPKFIVSSAVFVPNGMDERLANLPGETGKIDIFATNADAAWRQRQLAGFSEHAPDDPRMHRQKQDPERRVPVGRHSLRERRRDQFRGSGCRQET